MEEFTHNKLGRIKISIEFSNERTNKKIILVRSYDYRMIKGQLIMNKSRKFPYFILWGNYETPLENLSFIPMKYSLKDATKYFNDVIKVSNKLTFKK